jgi:copper resistance protein B
MSRPFSIVLIAVLLLAPTIVAAQDPHAGHTQPAPAKPQQQAKPKPEARPQPSKPAPAEDHSAHAAAGTETPKEPIPPLTDGDRAAAFPAGLEGHAIHDRQINTFVLFDQLEWQGGTNSAASFENKSWVGGDVHRLWFRAEADAERGRLETAHSHVLYGMSFSRWWDFVAGVRQDFRPGPAQTWAAFGVQGLAPYWFEIEATGYVGPGGRTHARFEAEYELLFTNRLILQPLIEAEIYGKSDPEREIAAGLSSLETGLRLRYEFRREFAPYVGVTWERKVFGTADLARDHGEDVGSARVAIGLRTWF